MATRPEYLAALEASFLYRAAAISTSIGAGDTQYFLLTNYPQIICTFATHFRETGDSILQMNIYVGNLNYGLTEDDLRQAFEAHGEVTSAKIIMDKFTGKAKGFGFVEMSDDESGRTAISQLNGADLQGRPLKVSEARPPKPRESSGSGW